MIVETGSKCSIPLIHAGVSCTHTQKISRTYIIIVVVILDLLFGIIKLCSNPASEYTNPSATIFKQYTLKYNMETDGQSKTAHFLSSSSNSLFFSSSLVLA